jgi:adenylate kinase
VRILILGPQGSGKGTQAKRIAIAYGIPHIATGEIFRAAVADGSELGLQVRPYLDEGELVPDELTVALIRERLGEPDAAEGFVLDGFPRTMAQAEALDQMLREIGRELTIVFEFQLPEGVCVERLTKRAELEGRTDDTPDAIRRRLELYDQETAPLIEYYRTTQGNVVGIHAERTIDEVFHEIQQSLSSVEART